MAYYNPYITGARMSSPIDPKQPPTSRLCGSDHLAIHRKLMMCNVGFCFPPVKVSVVFFLGEKEGVGFFV